MDHVLKKYCPRIEFDSYEDFAENFTIEVPEAFNFGFDVVDEWAAVEPDKRALLWTNDAGEERAFTFTDIKHLSNQAANAFKELGIGKGDVVMCILRRRWEYWVCAVALCKLGATIIPASLQLTRKDVVYRANSADVKAIVAVNDEYVCTQVEEAAPDCPTVREKFIVDGSRKGWVDFDELIAGYPDTFERPTGDVGVTSKDIMLMYFTSGTTGNPKAVEHNFAHPLGHIITAKYWQQVQENKLHMSVTDSGWAKFGWGKIYGQWIAGATIFAYDMDKFVPTKLLQKIQDYKLTTFCAPPTMYRFMLQEDVAAYDLSSVENFATAGEPLNAEVTIQWERLTGKKIREGFGQTEGPVLLATFPWIEPRPGSMGKPSPLLNVKLLDDDGREVDDGEEGAICVTGLKEALSSGTVRGLLRQPGAHGGGRGRGVLQPPRHGLARLDGYCYFVGRNDDVSSAPATASAPSRWKARWWSTRPWWSAAVTGGAGSHPRQSGEGHHCAREGLRGHRRAHPRAPGAREEDHGALQVPAHHRVRGRAAEDHRRQDQAQAHPPNGRHQGVEEIQASDASRRESVWGDRGRPSLPSVTTAGRGHSR